MWVIPSHNRVKRLGELIESMGPLDRAEPFLVVVCSQDKAVDDYDKMKLPPGWILAVASGEYTYCGEKMNWAFEKFPGARFYGHLCDDVLIGTPDRLPVLVEAAGDWHMSFPDDGIYDGRLVCFPCTGGELLRAIGFWAHPALKHNCIDSVLDDIARTCDLLVPCMDIKYICKHPFFKTAPTDETYDRVFELNLLAGDVYHREWAAHPMRREILERVKVGFAEYRKNHQE